MVSRPVFVLTMISLFSLNILISFFKSSSGLNNAVSESISFPGSLLPNDSRRRSDLEVQEARSDPLHLHPLLVGRADQDVGQRRKLLHLLDGHR
jgi:hypothetical protein